MASEAGHAADLHLIKPLSTGAAGGKMKHLHNLGVGPASAITDNFVRSCDMGNHSVQQAPVCALCIREDHHF